MGWQLLLGGVLILLSALLYTVHFTIFRDAHHIWIYLVGDIAFVPIEVLLVTLIIHQLLSHREKRTLLNKLNMVIGVFFTETGNELLRILASFNPRAGDLAGELALRSNGSDREFGSAARRVAGLTREIDVSRGDLKGLREFLVRHRAPLLRLLENPNLLEHDTFTDVLWAVVHLMEELSARDLSQQLPASDLAHLSGDIRRAYERTTAAWLSYTRHLSKAYPYLFSLAVRDNPFKTERSVVVRESPAGRPAGAPREET